MVLGIGEGSAELVLDKTSYKPGETIKAKAKLHLNAPKEARGLRAEFFGEKEESRTHFNASRKGGTHRHSTTVRVHEQRLELGSQKSYSDAEEFVFEFKVPEDAPVPSEGLAGAVLGMLAPQVRWFVSVSLDLPMSLDISKKIQVQIVK